MDVNKIKDFLSTHVLLVFLIGLFLGGGGYAFYYQNSVDDSCTIEFSSDRYETGENIIVEIAGAVEEQGVYELPGGSRLNDLILKARGFHVNADKRWLAKNLNLSTKLSDESKFYIPYKWELQTEAVNTISKYDVSNLISTSDESSSSSESSDSGNSNSGLVNVNTASEEVLDELPGIGPSYASKIVENRPYGDYQDFSDRSGLKANTLDGIKDLIEF